MEASMRARPSLRLFVLAGLAISFAAACGEEFSTTTPSGGSGGKGGSSVSAGGTGGTGASTSNTGGSGGNPCADEDADGFTTCDGDCNDKERSTHPGAFDICGDG